MKNDSIEMEEIRPGYFMSRNEVKNNTTKHGIPRISVSEWDDHFKVKSENYGISGFKDNLVWTNDAS